MGLSLPLGSGPLWYGLPRRRRSAHGSIGMQTFAGLSFYTTGLGATLLSMKHNENVDGNDIQPGAERRVLHLSNRRLLKRSEVIARDLAEHIVDSRLPAGTMLPREREMIEQ